MQSLLENNMMTEPIQLENQPSIDMNISFKPKMKSWEFFEIYVIDYHIKKHDHSAWLWNNCPENILFESGFIHDFKVFIPTK